MSIIYIYALYYQYPKKSNRFRSFKGPTRKTNRRIHEGSKKLAWRRQKQKKQAKEVTKEYYAQARLKKPSLNIATHICGFFFMPWFHSFSFI